MSRSFSSPSAVDALADFISDLDLPVMALGPADRILFANTACADLLDIDPATLPGAHILRLLRSAALERLLGAARNHAGPNAGVAACSEAGRPLICHVRRATGRPGVLLLTLEPDGADHIAEAELAHRVRNSLQMIASLVRGYEREGSASGYAAIRAHLSGVAALYDLMEQAGGGRAVRADRFLEGLAGALRQSLLGPASNVVLQVEAEPVLLSSEQAGPVGVIVNELVTNSMKHAFAEASGRGQISLQARRVEGELRISVLDNGRGAPADAKEGVGSRCISALVRQLGGRLERRRMRQGYEACVSFPDRADAVATAATAAAVRADEAQAQSAGSREWRLPGTLPTPGAVGLRPESNPVTRMVHAAFSPRD